MYVTQPSRCQLMCTAAEVTSAGLAAGAEAASFNLSKTFFWKGHSEHYSYSTENMSKKWIYST